MTQRCACGGDLLDRAAEPDDRLDPLRSMPHAVCPQCGRLACTVAALQRVEALQRAARPAG